MYATSNQDDEYVVIVLLINDPAMIAFYGGRYLI